MIENGSHCPAFGSTVQYVNKSTTSFKYLDWRHHFHIAIIFKYLDYRFKLYDNDNNTSEATNRSQTIIVFQHHDLRI